MKYLPLLLVLLLGCNKQEPTTPQIGNKIVTVNDELIQITVNHSPVPPEAKHVISYKDFPTLVAQHKGVSFVNNIKKGDRGILSYNKGKIAFTQSCQGSGWCECMCWGCKEKIIVTDIPECCMAWCGKFGLLIWCDHCSQGCYSAIASCCSSY